MRSTDIIDLEKEDRVLGISLRTIIVDVNLKNGKPMFHWASSTITACRAGYLGAEDWIGDHRLLWADLAYHAVFGQQLTAIVTIAS